VLSGFAIQTGCLLAGLALIAKVIGNMPLFSNGRLFDGLILLLIGLYVPQRGLQFLRLQCYLLYTGAVLSKLIDPDWWNGRFINAMLDHHLPEAQRAFLEPFTPIAGWLTIAAESSCAVLLMTPRLRWAGVLTVGVFHTSLLVLLSEDFGSFYYTVALCAALLFLPFPPVEFVAAPTPRLAFLSNYSVFTALRVAPFKIGPTQVRLASSAYTGPAALLLLVLTNLPCTAILVASAAFLSSMGYARTRDAVLAASVTAAIALWFMARNPSTKRYTQS
jgi:hypothetical protein